MHQAVTDPDNLARGERCRGCGTSLPFSDLILRKFQRCYYCGRHNPFGGDWRSLITPAIIVTAIAAVGVWWQTFS